MTAGQTRQPDKDTLSYRLLELIAISGELPVSQLSRIDGGSRYKEKVMKQHKARGLLSTFYKDKLRGYRLTQPAKDMLLRDSPERFGLFLSGQAETNRLKSEVTRRLRLHRIAECYVTMQNAGVDIFRNDKPDVFYDKSFGQPHIEMSRPAFYSSREIREIGAEYVKIQGARTVGTLIAPTGVFVVYNTGNALMKWSGKTEIRTRALMKSIVCIERLHRYYRPDDINAIMFGADMETAYLLLTSTGGVKKAYFMLDGSFDNFIYITNDHAGEVLLRLVCDKEKRTELGELLSEDLCERQPGLPVENDAIDTDGYPVLFGYDFDLPRIVRFAGGVRLHGIKGTIICFDYQADVLRRYCGDGITLQTIDLAKFERRFFS